MIPRRSRLGQLLAALLIRGSEAPYLLRDLDDAFDHDVARGLPAAEVRRRDLQNVLRSVFSIWAEGLRPSAWRPSLIDVRLGARTIRRTPGLTFVAVCALAIGIPIGLIPLQAVDALERPLPGDPDGRIRTLSYWRDLVREPATTGDFVSWRSSLRSFEAVAAYQPTTVVLGVGEASLAVTGIETTASAFEILRTPASLGRTLRPDDERPNTPAVVVIGHDLWRSQFGGSADVIGRAVQVGGAPATIVGVMPPGFRFPTSQQVWTPLRLPADAGGPRSGPLLVVFGRLADGVTLTSAQAEVDTLTASLATANPDAFRRLRATVLPSWQLTFDFPSPGGLRALPEFALVQVVMLAPLLVACVNVGLLVLAQTSTRATEFAVRTALGASRGRILTQVFVEFLVLAVIATGLGLLVLEWLPGQMLTTAGIPLPYWIDTGLSAGTVLRGLVLAACSAVIAGVVPAARMTGRSIDANIKRARASRSGARFGGPSSALIVMDVAVAMIAVGVAGGLWGKVQATRPSEAADGIRAEEVLSFTLDVRAATSQEVARTQTAVVDRLRGDPGVRAVTFATALPRMDHPVSRFQTDHEAVSADASPAGPFKVREARVAVDFFGALAQPVLAGRAFDHRDLRDNAHTIIVNTTFAQRALGAASPIGRRVRRVAAGGTPAGPWLEIVGVVGHMGLHPLTPSEDDGIYEPIAEGEVNPVRVAVWARGDPAVLAPRLLQTVKSVDPNAAVSMPTTLDRTFEGDWYLLRGIVLAVALLVLVLLSLAASALYALLSLAVTQRTREIGIRVALGADRWSVVRHVATRAVVQIGAGVLLGLPFALALSYEFLELTGTGRSLPGAVVIASTLGGSILLLVSIAGCTTPTLRALRIAPIDALRQEG